MKNNINSFFKTCFLASLILSIILLTTACPDPPTPTPPTPTPTPTGEIDTLIINFASLPVLDPSYVYEGWIIVDGSPISTGVFALDRDATNPLITVKPYSNQYAIKSETLTKATAFVLSIEPKEDSDPAPSTVKLLGGTFVSNTANASMDHPAAFGPLFTDSLKATKVSYKLATPTDNDATNERSGIWFLKAGASGPTAAGLVNLPVLPSGWKYEGWLVINGNPLTAGSSQPFPLTTGQFKTASGSDELNSFSSTINPAPPYPGEDFVQNLPDGVTFPVNIDSTDAVVISIEPSPDDNVAPFAFKPFVGFFENNVTNYEEKGFYSIGLDKKNPELKGTVVRQ